MANKFYNRSQTQENFKPNTDYSDFVSTVTEGNNSFELKQNSVLYDLAVEEINVTNFVAREDIPDWLCGFIDLSENDSYLSQEQQNINNFINVNESIQEAFDSGLVDPVRFVSDECLKYGVPGSYYYSKCVQEGDSERAEYINQLNFGSNFQNVDYIIDSTLTDLEDAVFEEVNQAILLANIDIQASVVGIVRRGSECNGCTPNPTTGGFDPTCGGNGDPFLWWIASNDDGVASVLLPCYMSNETDVRVRDKGNEKTWEGTFVRYGGARKIFVFNEPGINMGADVVLVARDVNMSWRIGNPGKDHTWNEDPNDWVD